MSLERKTETIPEIKNTKQAKTTCLIFLTFYREHQVDSTPRRHICFPNDALDHTLSLTQFWVDTFPLRFFGDFHYKLREPVVKRYGIHILYFTTNRINLVQFIINDS